MPFTVWVRFEILCILHTFNLWKEFRRGLLRDIASAAKTAQLRKEKSDGR